MTLTQPTLACLFALYFGLIASVRADTTPENSLTIDRIDGSTLLFKAPLGPPGPKPLKLNAIDITFIGTLKPLVATELPYFIVRARPSSKLDPVILIFQPSGIPLSRFVEPGKILDNHTRVSVSESRGFYGQCLAKESGEVLVFFQKDRVDKKRAMQSSVLVVAPVLDPDENGKATIPHLHEVLLDRRFPRIEDTLKRVRKELCHEITSRNRIMASHPPEVNLRHAESLDDKNDEDEVEDPAPI